MVTITSYNHTIARLISICGLAVTLTTALHANVVTSDGGRTLYLPESVYTPANSILMVTPLLNSGVRVQSPLGVSFSGSSWTIFTQDQASIPAGAQFLVQASAPDATHFVHQANSTNTLGAVTYIDSSACNGRASAILHVVAQYSEVSVFGFRFAVYNNSHIAVWYDVIRMQWAIFNQDGSPIATGMPFHVVVDPPTYSFVQSTFGTSASDTYLGVAGQTFNGKAYVYELYVTPRFSYDPTVITCFPGSCAPLRPGDVQQINRAVAVRYDASRQQWAITTEDGSVIPPWTEFNVSAVLIPPG